MDNTTLTIVMFAVLAVFVFLTWRSGRKRKAAAEEAKLQYVPGAEIMTNYGLFGTIKAVDGDVVQLEVAPKTVIRIHLGSIVKVVTTDDADAPKSVEEAIARATAEQEARDAAINAAEPEFGERIETEKPARRTSAKKTAE